MFYHLSDAIEAISDLFVRVPSDHFFGSEWQRGQNADQTILLSHDEYGGLQVA